MGRRLITAVGPAGRAGTVFARSPAAAARLKGRRIMAGKRESAPAPLVPVADRTDGPAAPSSLTRPADEAALREVERRIRMWMMRHVGQCAGRGEPPAPGLHLPRSPAIELYVDRYIRELWAVVPPGLKKEHAEIQARLEGRKTVTAPGGAGGGRPAAKGATVNERMAAMLQADTSRLEWSASVWAEQLSADLKRSVSPAAVKQTATWKKQIKAARAMTKADRAAHKR